MRCRAWGALGTAAERSFFATYCSRLQCDLITFTLQELFCLDFAEPCTVPTLAI